MLPVRHVAVCFLSLCVAPVLLAADQPQWGHGWTRNLVSEEKGLPESFDRDSGKNIRWTARLGNETHGSAIVSGGRVFIGTNNAEPRDAKHKGDRGVLMCFEEETGRFLWQLVVPKRVEDIFFDWPNSGICSPPTVEGDRLYVVSNRGEVLCLDVNGMANGNDGPFKDEGRHMTVKDAEGKIPEGEPVLEPGPTDADIVWRFDLPTGADVYSHDAAHSSILIHREHLYLNTGTGVDNTHKKIRNPESPSLVVLDKRTGSYLAREQEQIAPRILHSTWSGPSMATVDGRELLFFAAGDGLVYAFEPLAPGTTRGEGERPLVLKKVWQFDFDPEGPKENVHKYNGNRRESPSNFFGMPVFHDGRIFIAGGGDIWWGKNQAWLKCFKASGSGDITASNLLWSYSLEKHVLATPAVHNGLVFIADTGRTMHCVDATTGTGLWTHEIKGDAWASAYVADGKVYLGTRGGWFYVFAAEREKKVLSELEVRTPLSATPTAANGVLFIATMSHLYAVAAESAKP